MIYSLQHTLKTKRIVSLPGFISLYQTSMIMAELKKCTFLPSEVVSPGKPKDPADLDSAYSETRTSYTCFENGFSEKLVDLIRSLEKEIANFLETDADKFERWQAVNYQPGEKFDIHIDGGRFAKETPGDRTRTILVYLNTVEEGGNTFFRALNLQVVPEAGKLVVWENLLAGGLPDYAMVHGGLPVIRGDKTILVTWERQYKYRN